MDRHGRTWKESKERQSSIVFLFNFRIAWQKPFSGVWFTEKHQGCGIFEATPLCLCSRAPRERNIPLPRSSGSTSIENYKDFAPLVLALVWPRFLQSNFESECSKASSQILNPCSS